MTNVCPRGLKKHLPGTPLPRFLKPFWAGKKNGELLRAASGLFDVFMTVDRSLGHQQGIKDLPFGTVILKTTSNRLGNLLPLVPAILVAVSSVKSVESILVGG